MVIADACLAPCVPDISVQPRASRRGTRTAEEGSGKRKHAGEISPDPPSCSACFPLEKQPTESTTRLLMRAKLACRDAFIHSSRCCHYQNKWKKICFKWKKISQTQKLNCETTYFPNMHLSNSLGIMLFTSIQIITWFHDSAFSIYKVFYTVVVEEFSIICTR